MLRRLQRRQASVADSFDFLSALIGKIHAKIEERLASEDAKRSLFILYRVPGLNRGPCDYESHALTS